MIAAALLVASAFAASAEDALQDLWTDATEGAVWRSITSRERGALQDAVGLLARSANMCPAADLEEANIRLRPYDFVAERIDLGGVDVIAVHEGREHRGSGLLVLRCGNASPLLWQAPHSFFDLHTAEITRQVFLESGARAAMWNSVHRYRSSPDENEDDPVHPADVTREFGTAFHAMTVAVAAADPGLKVVQLHGFAERAAGWDVVVSTGDARRPPFAAAGALSPLGKVAAYGKDTDELGATTNVQGRALNRFSLPRFLHIELSPDVRNRLRSQIDARAAIIHAASVPL